MSVKVVMPTSREEWLALRRPNIGASVVGALLGVHEFTTVFELWALKTGRITADPSETAPMRRGRMLEPVAVEMLREERPTWRVEHNPMPGGKYFVDTETRLSSTPDIFAYDPERKGFGVVQVKSVEAGVYRRKWINPDTHEVEPPIWVAVQAIMDAHLSGASWAAVAPIVVSFGVEMPVIPIPLHPGIIERVRTAIAEFWKMVEEGREPSPDFARDGEAIANLYGDDKGTEIDLSFDNRIGELIQRRAGLKQIVKEAETEIDGIENEVKAKIGDNAVALLGDGRRITWRSQTRKGFYVEPKTFRVLRFPQAQKETA